ncbi:MAG TPA: hypothetical protein VFJ87_03700 [Rhodanobacteraceae bacterium]|nr:hypothetical protein [Rhodanobacteraceae bacterium]
MKKQIGLLAAIFTIAMLPLAGRAMGADQSAILNGAKKAFSVCRGLQGVHVLQEGSVVCLRGKIDSAMFVDLVRASHQIRKSPYVIISGPGGDENSAIYMVRTLDVLNPIPVVGDMCASSCAQFWFLMGRQRVMLHCADVAFHGGPRSIASILAANESNDWKQRNVAAAWRFEQFYGNRHVSMDMVTKPPASIRRKLAAGQVVFWPWSINALRAFGVKGIISANDAHTVVPKDYGKVCITPSPKAAGATKQ